MENNDNKYIEKMIVEFKKAVDDMFSECNYKLITLADIITDKIIATYNYLNSKPIILMVGKSKSGNITRYYLVRHISLENSNSFAEQTKQDSSNALGLYTAAKIAIYTKTINICFSDISNLRGKSNSDNYLNFFSEINGDSTSVLFNDIITGKAFADNKYFSGAHIESLSFEYFDTLESLILYMSSLEGE